MKKIAILMAFAVAACSGGEDAQEPVAEETVAAPEPVEVMAADGQSPVGTYEVTDADGSVTTQVVSADGTYVTTDADGNEVMTGTWSVDSPGRWCQTEGEAGEQKCYTETIDEDGVWTSVDESDPEQSSTIVRMS